MPNILTADELVFLLDVRTPHADARQIKRRCEPMLKSVRALEDYDGNEGCPHCLKSPDCRTCAYRTAGHWTGDGEGCDCLRASFGGVKYGDTHFKECTARGWLNWGLTFASGREAFIYSADLTVGQLAAIERFLLGHIEWAEYVLHAPDVEKLENPVEWQLEYKWLDPS